MDTMNTKKVKARKYLVEYTEQMKFTEGARRAHVQNRTVSEEELKAMLLDESEAKYIVISASLVDPNPYLVEAYARRR